MGDAREDMDESPTKRDNLRATCWNWRSVGRGAGVLSASGWATILGACKDCRLLFDTADFSSLRSCERLEICASMCCLIWSRAEKGSAS